MSGLSKKRERAIIDAISTAQLDLLASQLPEDILDRPPEIWSPEEREIYDLITECEMVITKHIEKVLESFGTPAFKRRRV